MRDKNTACHYLTYVQQSGSEISCALVLNKGGNNRQTLLRGVAARKHVPIIGAEHSRWNVVCVLQTDDQSYFGNSLYTSGLAR